MTCDGCDGEFHTYCAETAITSSAAWFCGDCGDHNALVAISPRFATPAASTLADDGSSGGSEGAEGDSTPGSASPSEGAASSIEGAETTPDELASAVLAAELSIFELIRDNPEMSFEAISRIREVQRALSCPERERENKRERMKE